MRGYLCLSILLGGFAFLTACYSFVVAFGVMYCIGMLAVTIIAFTAGLMRRRRSRALAFADQPAYPAGKDLIRSNNLHAA